MRRSLAGLGLFAMALPVAAAETMQMDVSSAHRITRVGSQPSVAGPADYSTGRAQVDLL